MKSRDFLEFFIAKTSLYDYDPKDNRYYATIPCNFKDLAEKTFKLLGLKGVEGDLEKDLITLIAQGPKRKLCQFDSEHNFVVIPMEAEEAETIVKRHAEEDDEMDRFLQVFNHVYYWDSSDTEIQRPKNRQFLN